MQRIETTIDDSNIVITVPLNDIQAEQITCGHNSKQVNSELLISISVFMLFFSISLYGVIREIIHNNKTFEY